MVRPENIILLSQCLSCLNFDCFIVLTSVGFGTMYRRVCQGHSSGICPTILSLLVISSYCRNNQCYARLFDNIIAVSYYALKMDLFRMKP